MEALEGGRVIGEVTGGRRASISIGYSPQAKELVEALSKLPADLRKEISAAIRMGARMVRDDARELLKATRAKGRRVRAGPLTFVLLKGRNEPSAPGAPPAQQSGELRRGLKVVRARRDGLAYRIEAQFYALWLEYGSSGPGKRKMEPRPFLSAALESNREVIEMQIEFAVARAVDAAQARAGGA